MKLRRFFAALIAIFAMTLAWQAPSYAQGGNNEGGADGTSEQAAAQDSDSQAASQDGEGGSGSGSTGGTGAGTGSGSAIGDIDQAQAPAVAGSMPKLVVTGVSTDPAVVTAGEQFTVNLSLKNMSSSKAMTNILVQITNPDGSLLPVAGTSSIFIDAIWAGSTSNNSMTFESLPSLEERPYPLAITMEYDVDGVSATTQESAAVLVQQITRVDVANAEAMPKSIEVNSDANVHVDINNRGKSQLFNLTIGLKPDQTYQAQDKFVGTVAPGTSASADLLVHTTAVGSDPITVLISYENANGDVQTIEHQVPIEVTEAFVDTTPTDELPEPKFSIPWIPIIVLLLIIGLVVFIVVRNRRKKKRAQQLNEQMAALDNQDMLVPNAPMPNPPFMPGNPPRAANPNTQAPGKPDTPGAANDETQQMPRP